MEDSSLLLVDWLLTESNLEAERKLLAESQDNITDFSPHRMDLDFSSFLGNLVVEECRICHEEDGDTNLEVPCSCRGSLKYAHRKCVQRWCNEKGDTFCEICFQQFKPGYTAPPPPLFHYGGIPMNFRGNWEVSRRDLHNPGLIATFTTDGEFLDSDLDEYSDLPPRSLICCRIVAIIFTVLLILRHALPIIIIGAEDYSTALLMFLILIGILLPIYVMVKAFMAIQRRCQQQDPRLALAALDDALDEENNVSQQQPLRSRFIHIQ